MNLSPHFTLAALSRTGRSDLAAANLAEAGAFVAPLTALCLQVLEPIRARFGAVSVHSAFRGKSVNAAAGGAATSQHCRGEAADIHCAAVSCETLLAWIATSGLPFDQVIGETRNGKGAAFGWVHVSHKPGGPNRHQVLCSYDGKTYAPWSPK